MKHIINKILIVFFVLAVFSPGPVFLSADDGVVRPEDDDPEAYQESVYTGLRQNMVESQIKARGITDPQVLASMAKVKRHLFVPPQYAHMAYGDHPVPIGYNQTISQPYIVAYMTEQLKLQNDDKVLEIGTGSGYQAAILAELAGKVYTIEIIKALADDARIRLNRLGYENVEVIRGDGYEGLSMEMPFDAIIVTAAPEKIPEKLIEQLKVGGRMIIPVGRSTQELYLITKTEEGIYKKRLLPVQFVPMVKGK